MKPGWFILAALVMIAIRLDLIGSDLGKILKLLEALQGGQLL